MQELNHKHMLVTAFVKNPPTESARVEKWLLRLVEKVGMKVLIEPKAVKCDTLGNEGVTGIVCIETSHASIHVWSECDRPFLKMDLYSCKEFDPNAVIKMISEFTIEEIDWIVVDRNDHMFISGSG